MRVAAAQLAAVPGDVDANVAAHADLVHAAAADGAQLIVFPELSLTGYDLERIGAEPALTFADDDPRLLPLQRACAATGATAVAGLPMPVPGGGRQLCALALRPADAPVRCAKTFLHHAEAEVFLAGDGPAVFAVDGRSVGLGVCFDAAHPEHARVAAAAGAELYACGAIFGAGSEDRIVEQATGRARETGMSVLFALTSGPAGPYDTEGGSGIWDSSGRPVVRLGDDAPALAIAELAHG
jgi:predicted amidohydrolase